MRTIRQFARCGIEIFNQNLVKNMDFLEIHLIMLKKWMLNAKDFS